MKERFACSTGGKIWNEIRPFETICTIFMLRKKALACIASNEYNYGKYIEDEKY